jgi:subtilisin family serine protease
VALHDRQRACGPTLIQPVAPNAPGRRVLNAQEVAGTYRRDNGQVHVAEFILPSFMDGPANQLVHSLNAGVSRSKRPAAGSEYPADTHITRTAAQDRRTQPRRPKIVQLVNNGIAWPVAGHKGARVLTHQPHHFAGFFAAAAVLLAALGAPEAQAQRRGLTAPLSGTIGSVGSEVGAIGSGVGSITSGVGSAVGSGVNSIGSGVTSGVGAILPANPGAGFFPGNTDLSVSGTLNTITNAVPIEGLYDGVRNTVTNTLNQTTSAIGKDPLGKGGPGAQPRPSRVPAAGERRFVAFEVLVGLPSNLTQQALDALARRHRLLRLESQAIALTGTTMHRWQISDQRSVADVVRALEADTSVRVAQPNYRFALQETQGRAAGEYQYALEKLRLPEAHRLATGGSVLVAVIDNGIDTTHPELADVIAASFDATGRPEPPAPHGTGMAGAIAAHARLTGTAPAARILAIRAFGSSGKSDESTSLALLKSVDWAVANGARVVNMSFAGPRDPELAVVLAAATKKGIVFVAAAGNAGAKSPPLYPAADPNVIAVTATDADDKLFVQSNRGNYIAVAAPGVDIVAPAPSGTYQFTSGTSVAAAQVSGIAALLLDAKPGLTPQAVRKALLSTARDLGPKGRDDQFGAGLADAYGAVQSLTASVSAPVANVSTGR